jgi:hypothetical protein
MLGAQHLPLSESDLLAVASGDLDADGDVDLVVANTAWENDGRGWFRRRTLVPSLGGSGQLRSLALGDLDGDGDLDVVVGRSLRIALGRNDGSGLFTDVTAASVPNVAQANYGVVLGDVDGDGDLDLVCVNSGQDRLFLNDGQGVFTDVTAAQMPADSTQEANAVFGDVDGDGDLDIVFGAWQNRLYLNDGTGTFTDASAARLPGDLTNTSVVLGDVDGDGDLDIVCANSGQLDQNRLYLNDGSGMFTDVTATHLPVFSDDTNAIALGDLDGDGDLDMYCANGDSYIYRQADRICLNDGSGRFADAGSLLPVCTSATRRVLLFDADRDGDLDVFCTDAYPQTTRLWLNLQRQLDAPFLLAVGRDWTLDAYAYGTAATGQLLMVPMLATGERRILLPGVGWLGLEPAAIVVLGWRVIPSPGGSARLRLRVPAVPALAGLDLFGQAAVVDAQWSVDLSNVTADRAML